jgi:hypothetical protein
MTFADYPAFRVALQWLIEGDELTDTFSTDVLDLIVGLGEQRVYRDLRASTMLADLSVAVSANAATLPAGLLALKEVRFSGERPLEILPLDRLRTLEADGTSTGDARFCAQDGDTLRFWPEASGTVLGRYYARPADLKTVTWAQATTFARYPEVFIYASLVEAVPFLGMADKLPVWEGKYQQALANAQQDERVRVLSGGPLRMRTR